MKLVPLNQFEVMRLVALLLTIFLAISRATGSQCTSKLICKSFSIKYLAYHIISNFTLNGTVVCESKTVSGQECMNRCAISVQCQSVNYQVKTGICQTLADNRHSNSSLLVETPDAQHLFIPSGCDSNPCQNDGICVPVYTSDTFVCQCRPQTNNTFVFWGKFCELKLEGIYAANWYVDFDTFDENGIAEGRTLRNGYPVYGQVDQRTTKILKSIERKSYVLYMTGVDRVTLSFDISSYPTYVDYSSYRKGISVVIWIKLEIMKDKVVNFISTGQRPDLGISIRYDTRNSVLLCTSILENMFVRSFGHVAQTMLWKWSHLSCVYNEELENATTILYLNGEKLANSSLPRLYSGKNVQREVVFGRDSLSSDFGQGFIDDAAIWGASLTPKEVRHIYRVSSHGDE